MKVLVTGVNGQLGYDVIKVLDQRGIEYIGAGRQDFDLTDAEMTINFIQHARPDAVIHCSAYTAVDQAEDFPDLCQMVNGTGTKHIAKACQEIGAKMIYISTDYVFPGQGDHFHEIDDATGPLSIYGKTKLEGEGAVKQFLERCFIVRTSWVFGKNGNNFVQTMLKLAKTYDEVNVVADQIGSPTYTADLAPLLCDMLLTDCYGTYHATNEGLCSWAEFAAEVFKSAGCQVKVNPIGTAEYPTKAARPKNSRLSKKSLDEMGFGRLPLWQDAVKRYIQEMGLIEGN